MLLKDFYNKTKPTAKEIPVTQINLVEKCHIRAKENAHTVSKNIEQDNLYVIITPNSNGTYNLISGWAAYMTAIEHDFYFVKGIIVSDKNKSEFTKRINYLFEKISIYDIKISKQFADNQPSVKKLVRDEDKILNDPDYLYKQPIRISENGYLMDGYCKYLVADELGIKEIPVQKMSSGFFKKYYSRKKTSKIVKNYS